MNATEGNFFQLPSKLPGGFELFETIISSGNVTIERIISSGQVTPEKQWLEEDTDEWVILLQGNSEVMFEDGSRKSLKPGNYLLIPRNKKHKVTKTSIKPECIWLAVHY